MSTEVLPPPTRLIYFLEKYTMLDGLRSNPWSSPRHPHSNVLSLLGVPQQYTVAASTRSIIMWFVGLLASRQSP